MMVMTGDGLFKLRLGQEDLNAPLPLNDFVKFVDGQGPQKVKRMTKNDIAFARQLVKKPS